MEVVGLIIGKISTNTIQITIELYGYIKTGKEVFGLIIGNISTNTIQITIELWN